MQQRILPLVMALLLLLTSAHGEAGILTDPFAMEPTFAAPGDMTDDDALALALREIHAAGVYTMEGDVMTDTLHDQTFTVLKHHVTPVYLSSGGRGMIVTVRTDSLMLGAVALALPSGEVLDVFIGDEPDLLGEWYKSAGTLYLHAETEAVFTHLFGDPDVEEHPDMPTSEDIPLTQAVEIARSALSDMGETAESLNAMTLDDDFYVLRRAPDNALIRRWVIYFIQPGATESEDLTRYAVDIHADDGSYTVATYDEYGGIG